ncbi:MAG: TlpA family protein disulfide reductase [Ignavibacteriae bacterium]|nr:TlpA family protein disulfide reductase [Ignavibacteriota bacterium]
MKTKILLIVVLYLFSFSNIFSQGNIDFSTETLNGEEIEFSEITKTGPTLVSFWALWCKPCRAEMKHLGKMYNKYSNMGFTILGINEDSPRSIAKVKSYVSSQKITFPIVTDPNQEIFQMFNGQSIPLTVLFNKRGQIVYKHTGYLPGDEKKIEAELNKILSE